MGEAKRQYTWGAYLPAAVITPLCPQLRARCLQYTLMMNSTFPTCTMFGWQSVELIAASMMAILSRFSTSSMSCGITCCFTATTIPRQIPLYTFPNCSWEVG